MEKSNVSEEAPKIATFQPLFTFVDPSFWSTANRLKVNEWKLDDSPKPIHATINAPSGTKVDNHLWLSHDSIGALSGGEKAEREGLDVKIEGKLHLYNTKNEFDQLDRKGFIENAAREIWAAISSASSSGVSLEELVPLLSRFHLTAYADIKNYMVYYWNCVPALIFPPDIRQGANRPVDERIFEFATAQIASSNCPGKAFLLRSDTLEVIPNITTPLAPDDRLMLVCVNPASEKRQLGWLVRNLLAAIAFARKDLCSLELLALKGKRSESFITTLSWGRDPAFDGSVGGEMPLPKVTGWERGFDGTKLEPRKVDLKPLLDPIRIMEQSVDLNLRLIRWQQAPSVDVDRFGRLRALVIGSGTLGSNLARALLGWGLRRFTFVDCSTVSYSNPIRQSLFTFEDAAAGRGKAEAAALALRRIFPSVEALGVNLKVPMPGHPYSAEGKAAVEGDCQRLEALVHDADLVLLVMDSREARWLPTLLAAVHNKLAITVALGFDSYVVVRHGATPSPSSLSMDTTKEEGTSSTTSPKTKGQKDEMFGRGCAVFGDQLACYFCGDVTAPGDSIRDRTLDQQCTITRAGISLIASGIAAELVASVVQHELAARAPALIADLDENAGPLGGTPHQIRGFLSRFQQLTPTVRRFDKCVACSQTVRDLYQSEGFTFLHRVFHDPGELERATGLSELHTQADMYTLDEMLATTDTEEGGSEC